MPLLPAAALRRRSPPSPKCGTDSQASSGARDGCKARALARLGIDGEVLGSGASGTVRLARGPDGQPLHAVKAVRKSAFNGAREAALAEAATMRRMSHAGICRLLDSAEDDLFVYLVLEYLDGGDLMDDALLQEGGAADERRAAGLMRQVLEALAYCHGPVVGLVHRDVKPENIMLQKPTEAGAAPIAKLIDFGLAVRTGARLGGAAGTVPYMAPEVPGASTCDAAMDLWSVGVVLHAVLVGELLPRNVRHGEVAVDLRSRAWTGPAAPSQAAADLVSRLLQASPATRISAAEALAHPWLTGAGEALAPVAGPALAAWGGRLKALARAFGQAAGCRRVHSLRAHCRGLPAGEDGTVPRDELAAAVAGLALEAEGSTATFAEEVLDHLDDAGQVDVLAWQEWLDTAEYESEDRSSVDDAAWDRWPMKQDSTCSEDSTRAPTPADSIVGRCP